MAIATTKKFDCYECDEDECDLPDANSFLCQNAISCWKSTVREEDDGTERNARGCIDDPHHVRLMCTRLSSSQRHHIECCKGDLCNGDAFPTLRPSEIALNEESSNSINITKLIAVLTPFLAVAILIICMLVFYRYRRRQVKCCASLKRCLEKQQQQQQQHSMEELQHQTAEANNDEMPKPVCSSNVATVATPSNSTPELKVISTGDSTIKEYLDGQSLTSGSGSGLPLLMQRTFSKQVSLIERLNNGKFGYNHQRELWRGIWQGENVVVKIYSSRSEAPWTRETEVYTSLLPSKHDNILGYLGSDTTSLASCTQLWIVVRYHSNGSLRDYLREKRLQRHEMFRACLSLTYGLLFLHTEIRGTEINGTEQGKKSMAHRNICSKNVLVKSDGSCAIADFGYAVTKEQLVDDTFLDHTLKRYMSPELLERTFDSRSMESFRCADMYSLGLVFWEICRRSVSDDEDVCLEYTLPYSELLSNDDREPNHEEMTRLVVTDQCRPEIPQHWKLDRILTGMGTMIKECWQTKASARLTILRVKKTLIKFASGCPECPDIGLPLD